MLIFTHKQTISLTHKKEPQHQNITHHHQCVQLLLISFSAFQIVVPALPGKAWKRQFPFRGDDGLFEDSFIEERRKGLEGFINKIAGHPLAQNERCLHMFLQEQQIDRNYVPGKIRNT